MLKVLKSLAVLILATSLTSCGSEKEKTVTINIVGEALPPLQSLGEIAKDYEAKTGIKVKINPFEFETALQKAQLDFTSGRGQYDIVMGIFFNHGRYYEAGYVTPFDDEMFEGRKAVAPSAFYPSLQNVVMNYKGRLLAYPFSAQTMFLWYRKDLFQNAGERARFEQKYGYALPLPDEKNPLTWPQYRDIAEFFSRPSGAVLAGTPLKAPFYGVALQMKRHPASFYEFTNFAFSFGGGFFDDKTGAPIVNSPQNVAALDFYLNLRRFAPPDYLQSTWDNALAQMQQGQVAMTIMWSDAPSALEDPSASRVVGKVGYSLVPIHPVVAKKVAVFGGWGFLLNAKGKHRKEAFDFVQWMSEPAQQIRWAKAGGLPGSAAIFDDPDYMKIPYMATQNEALKHLVSWPRDAQAEQFVNDGVELLSTATSGQQSAKAVLDQLQARAVARRVR